MAVNPTVIQGMDPAQLWQMQQQLNLQKQQLMQNMTQNMVQQQQVANVKKQQEYTSYSDMVESLVKANNGDLIQAMGVNPGFFKYGLHKFSGASAKQAEIMVENIRQNGIQNPETWAKISWMNVIRNPGMAQQYLQQTPAAETTEVKATGETAPAAAAVPAAAGVPQNTGDPYAGFRYAFQTFLQDPLFRGTSDLAPAPFGGSSPSRPVESTYRGSVASFNTGAESKVAKSEMTGLPTFNKDILVQAAMESGAYKTTEPDLVENMLLRDMSIVYQKNHGNQKATELYNKYMTSKDDSLGQRLTIAQGFLDRSGMNKVDPKATPIEAMRLLSGQTNAALTGGKPAPSLGVAGAQPPGKAPEAAGAMNSKADRTVHPGETLKDYASRLYKEGGFSAGADDPSQYTEDQIRKASPNTAKAYDAAPKQAAPAPAPAAPAPETGMSSPPVAKKIFPETYAKYGFDLSVSQATMLGTVPAAQSLVDASGKGPGVAEDIGRGIIAARNSSPGVRAYEAVATSNPDKAAGSPLAPKLSEALSSVGKRIGLSMEDALHSEESSTWDQPAKKAWRDTQIFTEGYKAQDFIKQYAYTMDQINMIMRNPKGVEASYQDLTAAAFGGGEGYIQNKTVNLAMDQLAAQIRQNAAQNAIDIAELNWKMAAQAASDLSGSTPIGMNPELWKIIKGKADDISKACFDAKTGQFDNNKLIKLVNQGNNKVMWDIYNDVLWTALGGEKGAAAKGSVDYKRWRLFDGVRSAIIALFPNSGAAQTAALKNYGTAGVLLPSKDLKGGETAGIDMKDLITHYPDILKYASAWGVDLGTISSSGE